MFCWKILSAVALMALGHVGVSSQTTSSMSSDPGPGPEDMHFPVVRSLNENIEKQMNAVLEYTAIYMKHAVYLASDNITSTLLRQVIKYKADNAWLLIGYAGKRELAPTPSQPQMRNLSKCSDMFGCWSLSLEIERELLTSLKDLFVSAGSHDDAEVQTLASKLVQDEMRSVREVKRLMACTRKNKT